MSVPYVFANAVGSIPLSELDANFAQVAVYSNTAGTVIASSQPNITAVGALSSLSVTGNVTANYFLGNGSQLTGIVANTTYNNSNVAAFLPTYTGNITANNTNITGVYTGNGSGLSQITGSNVVGAVANATYSLSANSATFAGTVTTAAQPNITSVGNLTALTISGNASAGNINTGILTATTLGGTLSTAAQPSITSVGNLSTLTVTGNATGGNILTAGIVSATGNITTAGYFVGTLFGNITGNLSVPGSNTEIIYNNNGNAGASAGLTFDSASNAVAVTGTVSAIGNITGGNLLTSGIVSAAGNVSGNYLLGNGSQISSLPVDTYIQNGNSAVTIVANGAITIDVTGTSNVTIFRPSVTLPGTYVMQMTGAILASGNIVSNSHVIANSVVATPNLVVNNISSDDSSFVTVNDGILVNGDIDADTVSAPIIKTPVVTVLALPAAATVGAGARSFVSDADSTTFGNLAVGGAANNVPVFSNGTAWYIG